MIDIHFIVNPIAGSGSPHFSETFLRAYFEEDIYDITVKLTGYKGHAIDLTKESIKQQAMIIVACGGDGTVNEVASTLLGSGITLGIVPLGSGNGLASNLDIPRNIKKALAIIKNMRPTSIDVGCVNQRYFFSNTGFGFTASVIKNYEALQKRTLWYYITASLKSFHHYFKKQDLTISIDGKKEIVNPFLVFISNSNVMGYNMSLTPKASLRDGLLDVIVVPKMSKWKIVLLGCCMLFKKADFLKEVSYFQTDHLSIVRKNGSFFDSQMDGETSFVNHTRLSISVKKEFLKVLA